MALTNKGCFKIDDGTNSVMEFKPKNLKFTYESLAKANSGRSDDGTMVISWVRKNIRKIEVEMPPMNATKLHYLLIRVSGKKYDMTFYDPRTGEEVTVQMYTSNSNGDCYSGVLYNGLYQGVSFSAIEV